jgi:hypothetical protein
MNTVRARQRNAGDIQRLFESAVQLKQSGKGEVRNQDFPGPPAGMQPFLLFMPAGSLTTHIGPRKQ